MTQTLLQVFNTYRFYGGEEASVHRICRHLSEKYVVHQCLFDSNDWAGPKAPNVAAQALMMWRNPQSIHLFTEMVEQYKPDAVLLHNIFPIGSAGIYRECVKRDLPMIQFVHNFRPFSVNGHLWADNHIEPAGLRRNFWPEIRAGAWQDSRLKTAWYALILESMHRLKIFSEVSAWVGISEFMKCTFVKAGLPESKVFALPHAWEIQETSTEKPDNQGYYLFLGRLTAMKGIQVLLNAWELLYNECGVNTPPLYIGGEGDLLPVVEEASRRIPSIRILGLVSGEKKRILIRNSKAMIAPSTWWEPLGLVTYEAYEFSKPMMAASSGGLSETVEHGVTGMLHKPGNNEELFMQVMEMEKSENAVRQMGVNGRRWLEQNTGKEKWLKEFTEILESALQN